MYKHIHTHTCTSTDSHAHTRTRTYAHAHTHTHTHAHTHTHTKTQTQTQTHTHTLAVVKATVYDSAGTMYATCVCEKEWMGGCACVRWGDGGWAKKGKKKFGTRPKKKPSPCKFYMHNMPRAGTGDSVGRFQRYRCSIPFNYHSNLSMCGTSLQNSIHPPDNWLLATPKEICDLNLSAVTLSMWSFRTPISIFCTKELYNPVFFLAQPPSPLYGESERYMQT